MARISISSYLQQCEDTDRFAPAFALELLIEVTPADPRTSAPFEILAALEEASGISIYQLMKEETTEDKNLQRKVRNLERLTGYSIEELIDHALNQG